jgi:SAM-dependent methyltransferase
MHIDVEDFLDFYATPLGQIVRRSLAREVRQRIGGVRGTTVIGLGYATPYLGAWRAEARRVGALMPSGQGAVVWPASGPVRSVLVEETQLPLPDNAVDRMIAIHALEAATRPGPLLREIWRVLAPEGCVVLVVPNRRGVWARFDHTPFGHGRPYSKAQLGQLLMDSLLTPSDWGTALHMPPFKARLASHRLAPAWERVGGTLSPGFGGVIVVKARKELMAPVGKVVRARAIRELATVRGGNG